MFSSRLTKQELDAECELIAKSLVAGGVNFLAIDFDRTFIATHTGGRVSFGIVFSVGGEAITVMN